MSAHLSRVPSSNAVDLLDAVGGYLAARRLCEASYEKEHVERAALPVEHLVLHNLAREDQSFGLLAKAVDEAKVTGLGIAYLVKTQWLILKAHFTRKFASEQMSCVASNVPADFWTDDDLVYSYGVVFAGNLNRVSIYRRGNKVLSVSERRFVETADELVTTKPTAVIRQPGQYAAPMSHEWGQAVQGEGNKRGTNREYVSGHRDQAGKNTAFRDALNVEPGTFVAGKPTIFISDSAQAGGQIQKIEGPFFLDLDQHSRVRLAHLLGPERFSVDDSPLRARFNFDGRLLNDGAVA